MDTKETNIILVHERSTTVIGNNRLVNLTSVAGKFLEILRAEITKYMEKCALIKVTSVPSEGIPFIWQGQESYFVKLIERKKNALKERKKNVNHLDFALGQITEARIEKRGTFLKI